MKIKKIKKKPHRRLIVFTPLPYIIFNISYSVSILSISNSNQFGMSMLHQNLFRFFIYVMIIAGISLYFKISIIETI